MDREEDREGPGRARRRIPLGPAVLLAALVGALVFVFVVRARPEEEVRRLIDRQIKLATAGRYDQLHRTLSARARAACPARPFVGALTSLPADFWALIEYRDIDVRVDGDRASVTYVITYNGEPIGRATAEDPDLYVRAPETVYGRPISVEQQLARLDREFDQGLVGSPRIYEERRAAILRSGNVRPVLFVQGQWYDDLDGHVRCA